MRDFLRQSKTFELGNTGVYVVCTQEPNGDVYLTFEGDVAYLICDGHEGKQGHTYDNKEISLLGFPTRLEPNQAVPTLKEEGETPDPLSECLDALGLLYERMIEQLMNDNLVHEGDDEAIKGWVNDLITKDYDLTKAKALLEKYREWK